MPDETIAKSNLENDLSVLQSKLKELNSNIETLKKQERDVSEKAAKVQTEITLQRNELTEKLMNANAEKSRLVSSISRLQARLKK